LSTSVGRSKSRKGSDKVLVCNPLKKKLYPSDLKTQSVPHSKHSASVIKTDKLIIAVCSEIHAKHMNTLCGQNTEFVNVKAGGTYSDHWPLEG